MLLAVLDAGAEEVNDLDEAFEVVCDGRPTPTPCAWPAPTPG